MHTVKEIKMPMYFVIVMLVCITHVSPESMRYFASPDKTLGDAVVKGRVINETELRDVDFYLPCDPTTFCPGLMTCCVMVDGQWGCCPLPFPGICCEDHIHCCPFGTKCNLEDETCDADGDKVICPDGVHACPGENTCCRTSDGWGCCPMPEAVCCSDEEHCCPNGYTCDSTSSTCISGERSVEWSRKTKPTNLTIQKSKWATNKKALKFKGLYNVCTDGRTFCPEGMDCCDATYGGRATCCPRKK